MPVLDMALPASVMEAVFDTFTRHAIIITRRLGFPLEYVCGNCNKAITLEMHLCPRCKTEYSLVMTSVDPEEMPGALQVVASRRPGLEFKGWAELREGHSWWENRKVPAWRLFQVSA